MIISIFIKLLVTCVALIYFQMLNHCCITGIKLVWCSILLLDKQMDSTRYLTYSFSFGVRGSHLWVGAPGKFLALCSAVTPGGACGEFVVLGIEPGLTTCQSRALTLYGLSGSISCPNIYHFLFLNFQGPNISSSFISLLSEKKFC